MAAVGEESDPRSVRRRTSYSHRPSTMTEGEWERQLAAYRTHPPEWRMRNPPPGWIGQWKEATFVVGYLSSLADENVGCRNTAGSSIFHIFRAESKRILPMIPLSYLSIGWWKPALNKWRSRLAQQYLDNHQTVQHYIHVHFWVAELTPDNDEQHSLTLRVTATSLHPRGDIEIYHKDTNSWSDIHRTYDTEEGKHIQSVTDMMVHDFIRSVWHRKQVAKAALLSSTQLPQDVLDTEILPFISYRRRRRRSMPLAHI